VPGLIIKLSDLMRHIIYDSRENYISLDKEIDFVNNFIELQKIRTSEKTKIIYNIKGDIPNARIAPLLFEPFIDNAFKHGLPGSSESDFISILFDFEKDGQLQFRIENNFEFYTHSSKKHSGIGLENVKKRLELLYTPDEYQLRIEKGERVFSVEMNLKLK
jgi:LytS/YehU family sensor histidine kinase